MVIGENELVRQFAGRHRAGRRRVGQSLLYVVVVHVMAFAQQMRLEVGGLCELLRATVERTDVRAITCGRKRSGQL